LWGEEAASLYRRRGFGWWAGRSSGPSGPI
jgi:hypothetical protein